ncbi:hypothetical protein MBLNU457_g0022t1 [Dothideomycetes sp. NU457]
MVNIRITAESVLDKYPARQHAARVARQLGLRTGLIYLPGTPTRIIEDSDQDRKFRQRRYFYYITGVDEADCAVTYDIATQQLNLWLPPIDPRKVVWTGRGSNNIEAVDKYDIDHAEYTDKLPRYLRSWVEDHKFSGHIYILHESQKPPVPEDVITTDDLFDSTALQPAIDTCRLIKDNHEIGLIRKANEISTKAHTAVLRNIAHFHNEGQVEGLFLNVCVANGAKKQSYGIIAGSGSNAAILHYVKNDEDFGDRQMMVLDAGAEWNCYSSDVTRSFPLKGEWPSREAKNIYNLVQKMQSAAFGVIGPGKPFIKAHLLAHKVAVEGLLELGILHNGTVGEILDAGTSFAFYPHGLGHHLGLEVHDIMRLTSTSFSEYDSMHESLSSNEGLQPGMAITVEPGIYFNAYALKRLFFPDPLHSKYINRDVLKRYMPVGGVRIEDDILITHDGWEMLTTTPKGEEALKIIRGEC